MDFETPLISKKNSFGQTPLILACYNGKLSQVRYLLEEAKVDINQRGNIWMYDRYRLINGTALHAAVIASQAHVVSYLMNHISEIDLEATVTGTHQQDDYASDEGATALHLAVCHLFGDEQTEIISLLLFHGANGAINNAAGKQCWELANSVNLAKLFIDYGVGLNPRNNSKSSTIAHLWAPSTNDRSVEVIAKAMDKGISINQEDANGLTPIMLAAIGQNGRPNVEIFEQIFHQNIQPISRLDRIKALELLGATSIFGGQRDKGFEYWKKAMEHRFDVTDNNRPHIKSTLVLPPAAEDAFKGASEVLQKKEDLETVASMNLDELTVQAELVYIRILGLDHKETLHRLCYNAYHMHKGDPVEFLKYTNMILLNCDSIESHLRFSKPLIVESMFTIADSLPILHKSISSSAMTILDSLFLLLQNTRDKKSAVIGFTLGSMIDLAYVMVKKGTTSAQRDTLKELFKRARCLEKKDENGNDLVSLACLRIMSSNYVVRSDLGDKKEASLFKDERISGTVLFFLTGGRVDSRNKNENGKTSRQILNKTYTKFPLVAAHVLSNRSKFLYNGLLVNLKIREGSH